MIAATTRVPAWVRARADASSVAPVVWTSSTRIAGRRGRAAHVDLTSRPGAWRSAGSLRPGDRARVRWRTRQSGEGPVDPPVRARPSGFVRTDRTRATTASSRCRGNRSEQRPRRPRAPGLAEENGEVAAMWAAITSAAANAPGTSAPRPGGGPRPGRPPAPRPAGMPRGPRDTPGRDARQGAPRAPAAQPGSARTQRDAGRPPHRASEHPHATHPGGAERDQFAHPPSQPVIHVLAHRRAAPSNVSARNRHKSATVIATIVLGTAMPVDSGWTLAPIVFLALGRLSRDLRMAVADLARRGRAAGGAGGQARPVGHRGRVPVVALARRLTASASNSRPCTWSSTC